MTVVRPFVKGVKSILLNIFTNAAPNNAKESSIEVKLMLPIIFTNATPNDTKVLIIEVKSILLTILTNAAVNNVKDSIIGEKLILNNISRMPSTTPPMLSNNVENKFNDATIISIKKP